MLPARIGTLCSCSAPASPPRNFAAWLVAVQWWRDALNDCFKGKPPAQPVITALAEVLRCGHQLTRYRLQQLVSAREEDLLRTEQPASLAALERYAEGTAGQLLHLQLEAAGLGATRVTASR